MTYDPGIETCRYCYAPSLRCADCDGCPRCCDCHKAEPEHWDTRLEPTK